MIITTQEILSRVRQAIDMNRRDEALLVDGDVDTGELDDMIVSKIEEAARQVESEAPAGMLEPGYDFGEAGVSMAEHGRGWIILPKDFNRLLVFKMSDWRRPVTVPITELDDLYSRQFSEFRGIAGNPEKPVVAITMKGEGKVLEFFSCRNKNAEIEQAVYRIIPRLDEDGGIDVSEECIPAFIYRTAALALLSLGQSDMSAALLEQSKNLLS